MPKSKVRKRAVYTPPADVLPSPARVNRRKGPSPTWYPVTMVVLMLLGLAYIVLNYLAPNLAGEKIPVMKDINSWNFAIGLGLMVSGLFMAVRWR